MSSMPSQLNEAANVPIFENMELFQVDSDVEEEDMEQIQHDVNVKIPAARIHNEKICQDQEDQKRKGEETGRRRKRRTRKRPRRRLPRMPRRGK